MMFSKTLTNENDLAIRMLFLIYEKDMNHNNYNYV